LNPGTAASLDFIKWGLENRREARKSRTYLPTSPNRTGKTPGGSRSDIWLGRSGRITRYSSIAFPVYRQSARNHWSGGEDTDRNPASSNGDLVPRSNMEV